MFPYLFIYSSIASQNASKLQTFLHNRLQIYSFLLNCATFWRLFLQK